MEPTDNNNFHDAQSAFGEPLMESATPPEATHARVESPHLPWWRRLLNFFFNDSLELTGEVDVLRNDGNPITMLMDRYIFRRHCPYCFSYVSKRIYRERSRSGARSRASGVRFYLPNLKTYECPHCQSALPPDFFASMASSIALVGGTDSGKSSFITVFCDILLNKNSILNELGVFGSIVNPDGAAQFESNRRTLIEQQTTLVGTIDLQRPIVVRLQSKYHKKSMYITLIDSPGEHFEDLATLVEKHQNLQYANGIIFLMNPLDIGGIVNLIRQQRPGTLPPPHHLLMVPNFNLVENLYKLYVATKRTLPNHKIKVPTVFCLSRADLLEDVANLYIPEDSDTNLQEIEDIEEEMELVASDLRELLEETDMRLLNLMDKSFANYKLFPVSPLGKTPDRDAIGQKIKGGIEPKGILQPFIWILRESNFIKKA
jgi:hypothetical protein